MARRLLVAALAAGGLLAATTPPARRPLLMWNATASAPLGLWRISGAEELSRGQWVAARPPGGLAAWMAARGYLPVGVPLLKRVAALPGDRICLRGRTLQVDGAPRALALRRDRLGRPFTPWRGCRRLAAGEVLLLGAATGSVDGRYFGPSRREDVIGLAHPLWVRSAP